MKDQTAVTYAKAAYTSPQLTNYGNLRTLTQGANQNGNGAFNHINKKGKPGCECHGGYNHQYKHHGLSAALFATD